MSEETRLLHALKESGIKRIAVVDDAFDPPEIAEGDWGAVLAHVKTPQFTEAIKDLPDVVETRTAAIAAIENSELESDELTRFTHRLFEAYLDSDGDTRLDPANQFSQQRADNLRGVRPILRLLSRADPAVKVERIGSMESDDFAERISDIDLVFADFFLDPTVTAENQPDDAISQEAQRKSKEMIEAIIQARGKTPSIVLMSSKDVASRALAFRHELGPAYVAARFQFLEKGHLMVGADDHIEVQEPAADTLLDILQTFRFGEGLSLVLELWKKAATEAVSETSKAISDLEIRDFAYLIRFRLEKEGQELLEYLEWLFGEYLIDETAQRFYSLANDKEEVRSVAATQASVEGAFDGQSHAVARIYHRVRVEDPRPGRAPSLRLGDLFLTPDGQRISAVLTPECDLVVRGGKRRAKRLTLVNGQIKAFDRKNTSAAEFILIDSAAKNIQWSKKDIETKEFGWATDAAECKPIGTLRPMYAQQLQRAVLNDLGRVGLATWPALYVTADVELWYADDTGASKRISIPAGTAQTCVVMPGRPMPDGPAEKHVAVFPRSLMRKVRGLLAELDPNKVLASAAAHLAKLDDSETDIGLAVACRGVEVGSTLPHGILVTQESPPAGTWCWLAVRVGG